MVLRSIVLVFFLYFIVACNQSIKVVHPEGFERINDSCFIQIQNKSKAKLITNNETIIIEKSICNEFEIEIPFTERLKKTDTISVGKIDNNNFLYSIIRKLHFGDTVIVCIPWQGLFASEKLKPTIKLASSQKVFVHLVIKNTSASAFHNSINNERNTNVDTAKLATTNSPNQNSTSAITKQKTFVPLSGDEFEKEEFTLRYFLEYTKPYLLKHEIQPGFFLLLTQKGTGDFAQMGDIVTIDYVGRFAMDGKKFDDSSFNPDPFEFELGKPDQILKGLEKALYRMRLGSRAEVYFSSRYGYGAEGSSTGIVGKYKSLTFAVHLKKINKKQNELN